MSNAHELSDQIHAAFPAIKVPGFRWVRLLKQLPGGDAEHLVIYDLNASQSPIYGIGTTNEEATADLINRKAAGYAYLFTVENSAASKKKISELLWQYHASAALEVPEKNAVAISTAVSRFDLEYVIKKLGKKLLSVSIF
jgi:hypothetical protein